MSRRAQALGRGRPFASRRYGNNRCKPQVGDTQETVRCTGVLSRQRRIDVASVNDRANASRLA
jgi:hypothetical protein